VCFDASVLMRHRTHQTALAGSDRIVRYSAIAENVAPQSGVFAVLSLSCNLLILKDENKSLQTADSA
jgi:hypothetical protein